MINFILIDNGKDEKISVDIINNHNNSFLHKRILSANMLLQLYL